MNTREEIAVLVIEDIRTWQEIYLETLGSEGLAYNVDIADSYEVAFEKLNSQNVMNKTYDLVIVDLKIPKVSNGEPSFDYSQDILVYLANLNLRPKVLITSGQLDIPQQLASMIESRELGDEFVFLPKAGESDDSIGILIDYVKRLLHEKIMNRDLLKFGGKIFSVASGLNGILKRILQHAIELTGSNIAHILFPVGDDALKIFVGTGQDPLEYRVSTHDSVTGKAYLSKSIANIPDTDREPLYKNPKTDTNMKSELAVPLFDDQKVIGVLNLESEQANAYNQSNEEITSVFADLIVVTLLNEQKRREVDVTSTLLNDVLNYTNIQKSVLEKGAQHLGAQIGGILMRENDRLLVEATYPEDLFERIDKNGFSISDSVSGFAVMKKKVVNVKDVKNDEPYNKVYKSFGMEMKSEIVAPIEIRGNIIGVLNFEHSQRSFFTEYDEAFLVDLAKQTAVAMEKSVLLRELNEQMEERLIGEITHRLTNPLGLIRAWIIEIEKKYAELITTNLDLDKYFTIIKNNSIKAMELISQIKAEQGKLYAKSIDVMEHIIIAKQDEKIAGRLNDIDIIISSLNQQIFVRADEELWRIFVNFIENSIDALVNGEKKIEIIISESDKIVNIQITDTGRGIPLNNKFDIFKPWYSSKEGTHSLHGMGLPWTKRYIETYGGKIESVESLPQKGSSIRFSLLRASQDDTVIDKLLT